VFDCGNSCTKKYTNMMTFPRVSFNSSDHVHFLILHNWCDHLPLFIHDACIEVCHFYQNSTKTLSLSGTGHTYLSPSTSRSRWWL